jgi:peptidase C39-like protein
MTNPCAARRQFLLHGKFIFWMLFACFIAGSTALSQIDPRGSQFIGFHSFSNFKNTFGGRPGETVLTSPEIISCIAWNELVASWNMESSADSYLNIEARAIYPDRATKYYTMGLWSGDPSKHPRESVLNQKDDDGDVATDTLALKSPCGRFQLRVTLGTDKNAKPKPKFLGICLLNSETTPATLLPNRAAWAMLIPVPERSQMVYPGGKELCSPTTVSMMMTYWAQRLKRSRMDQDVPEVAKAVYDSNWIGTGNWPFNTAYAGSFPGMRAYISRFSDVSELEDWIVRGIPVGVSLSYNLLRGEVESGHGHVVVCVGFTKDGDVIVNDPGTTLYVRKTFPRKSLIAAWACSHNTVYLIYSDHARLPIDRFGHWDSGTSRRRIVSEK